MEAGLDAKMDWQSGCPACPNAGNDCRLGRMPMRCTNGEAEKQRRHRILGVFDVPTMPAYAVGVDKRCSFTLSGLLEIELEDPDDKFPNFVYSLQDMNQLRGRPAK